MFSSTSMSLVLLLIVTLRLRQSGGARTLIAKASTMITLNETAVESARGFTLEKGTLEGGTKTPYSVMQTQGSARFSIFGGYDWDAETQSSCPGMKNLKGEAVSDFGKLLTCTVNGTTRQYTVKYIQAVGANGDTFFEIQLCPFEAPLISCVRPYEHPDPVITSEGVVLGTEDKDNPFASTLRMTIALPATNSSKERHFKSMFKFVSGFSLAGGVTGYREFSSAKLDIAPWSFRLKTDQKWGLTKLPTADVLVLTVTGINFGAAKDQDGMFFLRYSDGSKRSVERIFETSGWKPTYREKDDVGKKVRSGGRHFEVMKSSKGYEERGVAVVFMYNFLLRELDEAS